MVYLRLAGKPVDIYRILEPFYSDYRKIRKRNVIGKSSLPPSYMDWTKNFYWTL
jgi:hypothetical protein